MTVSAERVAPGPPLGQDAVRARPCGRVAGAWPGPPEVLVDEDACTLDGAPITDWARVLDRLGEVCGAFALAARVDDALLLARDGVGERTLFYAQVGDGVVFGPSPGAVLASGRVARRVHIPSVAAYLVYAYVPGERTMVEDVREVLPGELLTFRPGRPPERRRLWRLPAEPSGPSDEGALRVRLRAALDEAVRRRLPHGEVGATLSGGIDSSLVVALAARMHSEKIRTWSVSFGDEYRNELPFSNLVARHCDTRHTVLELPAETVVRHLDEAIA
ncbi:MAG: hypothetical protein FJX76_06125, partial [Armatimonadetes bacterium]|nr:hypothetical protein [Armatimonadota bacterium]